METILNNTWHYTCVDIYKSFLTNSIYKRSNITLLRDVNILNINSNLLEK
jgi:hypothetical protein